MKKFILLLLMCVMVLLAGCSSEEGIAQISYNETAITNAKKMADPWASYQLLDARYKVAMTWLDDFDDRISASNDKLKNEMEAYLPPALKLMTPGAFALMLDRAPHAYLGGTTEQQKKDQDATYTVFQKFLPEFLSTAESSNDSFALLTAGKVFASGKIVVKDTQHAVELFARSWALGNPEAASEASNIFYAVDDKNAYLWALRCIGECFRPSGELSLYEKKLGPEIAVQVQRAATDPKTIFLGTVRGK